MKKRTRKPRKNTKQAVQTAIKLRFQTPPSEFPPPKIEASLKQAIAEPVPSDSPPTPGQIRLFREHKVFVLTVAQHMHKMLCALIHHFPDLEGPKDYPLKSISTGRPVAFVETWLPCILPLKQIRQDSICYGIIPQKELKKIASEMEDVQPTDDITQTVTMFPDLKAYIALFRGFEIQVALSLFDPSAAKPTTHHTLTPLLYRCSDHIQT